MNAGKIIFLNGTSSSGKTSILHALQKNLEEIYLEAGIDKFIFMLPKRYLEGPLWDEVLGQAGRAGQVGQRLVGGMHAAIAALSKNGMNVIADHVLVEEDWARDCSRLFFDLPAYLIGLRCPLEVLELRERSRRDRTLGQARLQFDQVHKFVTYDLEVDTSRLGPEECADEIRERMQTPPSALQLLRAGLHSGG